MANQLDDGTIVPHFLGVEESDADDNGFLNNLSNFGLRPGEIVAEYKPSDKKNVTKKFYEYDVLVYQSDGNGASAPQLYQNCLIADVFGNVADFVRFTPRIVQIQRDGRISSLNSRVMLQCPNGDTSTALIVGFLKHDLLYGEMGKEKEDLGHNLEFEFNGLNLIINNEGELKITRKSPTKPDGTFVDTDAAEVNGGGTIIVDANGGMSFNSGGSTAEFIKIDHTNQRVDIDADNGIRLGGDFADEPLILGDTYCQKESQFLQDMSDATQQLQAAIGQLATGLGTVLADSGSSAAAAATLMLSAVGQLQGAIQTFSAAVTGGKSALVLSKKNTTD